MTIFNLGSINLDYFYSLSRLPEPGETISATEFRTDLGGKGANQTVAIARAGGDVHHIGVVNHKDLETVEVLRTSGADISNIHTTETPTGHAIIYIDGAGENSIVLFGGANLQVTREMVDGALDKAKSGDWLLLQNETNMCSEAAKIAKERGMKIAYSAAPFDKNSVAELLPILDLLVVNQVEYEQLVTQVPDAEKQLEYVDLIVTKGERGSEFRSGQDRIKCDAFPVDVVDTTGAGDTFLGYFLANIDKGADIGLAMKTASAAGAVQASRQGTISAIPTKSDVDAFLGRS